MQDCSYCDSSFPDEDEYLDHLASEHGSQRGAIDRRRVANHTDSDDQSLIDPRIVPLIVVFALVIGLAIVAFVIPALTGGGGTVSASGEPTAIGSVHYHGSMTVEIEGRQVDFSRQQYQLRDNAFHFEGGTGSQWHVHARGVTLQYALDTLGISVSGSQLEFDGQTYDGSNPNTSIEVLVNGATVDPAAYVLDGGDSIRIVVSTR